MNAKEAGTPKDLQGYERQDRAQEKPKRLPKDRSKNHYKRVSGEGT
jgi:hypothetical protein